MNSPTIKCPECPYDKSRNMGTHLFFVHGYSKNRISEWRMNMKADTLSRSPNVVDIFRCQFCPKTYRRQNSCRAHERVVHCVSFSSRQKCVPCPVRLCTFSTTALLDLCAHAKESHAEMGDFSIREARFENLSLFQAWRLEYEDTTQTVLATESVNSNAAAGTTLRYLRCAQLEAQIRKVRNQMRQTEARGGGRMAELTEQGMAGEGDEDEEEREGEGEERGKGEGERRQGHAAPPSTAVSSPRRSTRKRKLTGAAAATDYGTPEEEEDEGYGRKEKEGYGSCQKKAKEEKEEGQRQAGGMEDEEEEEIDVEELDDNDEKPSTSAVAFAAKRSLPLPPSLPKEYDHTKDDDRAPRLLRASSAHLADDDILDQDESEAREEDDEESMYEQRARGMNSRHCTAHMRVLVLRSGAVHVEYCVSHLGHEVIPIPPAPRPAERRSEREAKVKPMVVIAREVEEDIERAKQRRKGRRETENRWKTERRMRVERDEFAQLCNRYDDIGANVELYEAADEDVYDEEELQVEEVIEEELVEQEDMGGEGRSANQ